MTMSSMSEAVFLDDTLLKAYLDSRPEWVEAEIDTWRRRTNRVRWSFSLNGIRTPFPPYRQGPILITLYEDSTQFILWDHRPGSGIPEIHKFDTGDEMIAFLRANFSLQDQV